MQRFGLRNTASAQENAAGLRGKEEMEAPTRPITRAALGSINNAQPSKALPAAEIKKTGYGAQGQSRLLTRPPLHKENSVTGNNRKSTTASTSVFAGKALRSSNASNGPLPASKPVTRASAKSVCPKTPEDVEMPSPNKTSSPMALEAEFAEITEDRGSTQSYSSAMIPDIDEGDEEDPQLAATFAADIFRYLRYFEKQQGVSEDFLQHKVVTPRMRGILVDWLHQVHNRFHLLPETMFLTVQVVDRYLEKVVVSKDQLQLVGVTGMLIASKYEEMYAPEINDFVYITDDTYTAKQILAKELTILSTLGCNLGRPLPIHFLRRFSKAAGADGTLHTLAKYAMESGTCDYALASVLPSHLAGASLLLSLSLIAKAESGSIPSSLWTPTLTHYSGLTQADLAPTLRKLAKHLHKVHTDKTKLQAVRHKFASPKFAAISNHKAFDVEVLKTLAA